MNTKEEVEEWLNNKPKSVIITSTGIEEIQSEIHSVGHAMPFLISRGFEGHITFKCTNWYKK